LTKRKFRRPNYTGKVKKRRVRLVKPRTLSVRNEEGETRLEIQE